MRILQRLDDIPFSFDRPALSDVVTSQAVWRRRRYVKNILGNLRSKNVQVQFFAVLISDSSLRSAPWWISQPVMVIEAELLLIAVQCGKKIWLPGEARGKDRGSASRWFPWLARLWRAEPDLVDHAFDRFPRAQAG